MSEDISKEESCLNWNKIDILTRQTEYCITNTEVQQDNQISFQEEIYGTMENVTLTYYLNQQPTLPNPSKQRERRGPRENTIWTNGITKQHRLQAEYSG